MSRLLGICLLAAGLLVSACGEGGRQAPLRIAIVAEPGQAPALLARKMQPANGRAPAIDLLLVPDLKAAMARYAGGEVDGYINPLSNIILNTFGGTPTVIVGTVATSLAADALVVRPGLEGPRALAGRTVGYDGFNSYAHLLVLRAIEQADVEEETVNFRLMPHAGLLPALEKHEMDAALLREPALSRAREKGFRILFSADQLTRGIVSALAVSPPVAASRGDELRSLMARMETAAAALRRGDPAALKTLAGELGIAPEQAAHIVATLKLPTPAEQCAQMEASDRSGTLRAEGYLILNQLRSHGLLANGSRMQSLVDDRVLCGAPRTGP